MLVCFGAAWPFSVYKSWKSRMNQGKSVMFLWVVFLGYLSGIAHKLLFNRDPVIAFYVVNAALVGLDLGLYYRNAGLARAFAPTASKPR
jgi:hypothetical protein